MKIKIKNPLIVSFLLSVFLTLLLYWPINQRVTLNSPSNIDQKINRLNLPLGEDIREFLDRSIQLPLNRHKLCLKNRNGFHFIHADSGPTGLLFYTDDLNKKAFGRQNKLGAMGINFYYKDNSSEVMLYQEFGQPKECQILEVSKLKNYASSTVEYSYTGLNQGMEFDFGTQGKLAILRPIVGGYLIDTSRSSLRIMARWEFLLLTFFALWGALYKIINWLFSKIRQLSR